MIWKTLTCISLLLEITAAIPQFTMTLSSYSTIQPGLPFDITWAGASGPVTLLLKNGPSDNLATVATIASGLTGTSYVWSPSTSLATGEYALEIEDSTGPNYSEQFAINGVGVASSATTQTATLHLGGTSTGTTGTITSKTSSLSSTSLPSTTSNPSTSTSATTSSPTTSSSITTSLSSPSTTASTPQSVTSTPQPHQSLSTGAKAGIGVGATLGALLFISIVAFAFWYGRRSAAKNKNSAPGEDTVQKAELEARTAQMAEMGEALREDEKRELERRRRAAELEGNSPVASGVVSERAELEARRSGKVFEMS